MQLILFKQLIIFATFLLVSTTVNAGITDLSLTIEFDGIENGVSINQSGSFRIIVTNNGPDPAGLGSSGMPISIFSPRILLADDGTEATFTLDSSIQQTCTRGVIAVEPRPPDPPSFITVFRTPVIAPEETVVCHGIFSINFNQGSRTYVWFLNPYVEDDDPDFENNTDSVFLGISAQSVPTLNKWGILSLVLVFMFYLVRSNKVFLEAKKG